MCVQITFHEKSSFTFLENLNSKNMSNMFTKSLFNAGKLPFISKYVQFVCKLCLSDEKVQRPPKYLRRYLYSYLNNRVTFHETNIYIILISRSIFYRESRLTCVQQITFHGTKIKNFTFHTNRYRPITAHKNTLYHPHITIQTNLMC